MKSRIIIYLTSILSFFSPVLQAQLSLSPPNAQQLIINAIPAHCSPEAATLSMDLKRDLPLSTLQTKYPLSHRDSENFVPALIKVSDDFNPSAFAAHQVQVNTDLGTLYSIHIPVSRYQEFIGVQGITYIELSKKIFSRLDQALQVSGVQKIHMGENLY